MKTTKTTKPKRTPAKSQPVVLKCGNVKVIFGEMREDGPFSGFQWHDLIPNILQWLPRYGSGMNPDDVKRIFVSKQGIIFKDN